jgi:hypothetical protein
MLVYGAVSVSAQMARPSKLAIKETVSETHTHQPATV